MQKYLQRSNRQSKGTTEQVNKNLKRTNPKSQNNNKRNPHNNFSTSTKRPNITLSNQFNRTNAGKQPYYTPIRMSTHQQKDLSAQAQEVLNNTFIFMDLDGTLLPSKSPTIPLGTSTALYSLQKHGVKRVLVTGRGYESTIRIIKDSHNLLKTHLNELNVPLDNDQEPILFDYIITSSGAATSDHTYDIIDKRSIPTAVAAKCTQFLHQFQLSYFIQHDIPMNHRHHQYQFGVQDASTEEILKEYIEKQMKGLIVDEMNDQNAVTTIQLPPTFCAKQYNLQLPTDHNARINFHEVGSNSSQFNFDSIENYDNVVRHLNETIGQQVSQFVIPIHRNQLVPITSYPLVLSSDTNGNKLPLASDETPSSIEVEPLTPLPPLHGTNTAPINLQQYTKSTLFNTSCECCQGDYILHNNPQDLISHLSQHLFHYLKHSNSISTIDPYLSGDDPTDSKTTNSTNNKFIEDYRTELTPVHCTSPFDHKSVWFEILPAFVNKDHAVENIIQHIYHPHRHSVDNQRNQEGGGNLRGDQRPAALFAFGNDFNDLPMLKYVKSYSKSSLNQSKQLSLDNIDQLDQLYNPLTASYMIETVNCDILRACEVDNVEIIGKCEESAVGQQLYKIIDDIIKNNP